MTSQWIGNGSVSLHLFWDANILIVLLALPSWPGSSSPKLSQWCFFEIVTWYLQVAKLAPIATGALRETWNHQILGDAEKQRTDMATSTMTEIGCFPSLMIRFPKFALMGCFPSWFRTYVGKQTTKRRSIERFLRSVPVCWFGWTWSCLNILSDKCLFAMLACMRPDIVESYVPFVCPICTGPKGLSKKSVLARVPYPLLTSI